MTVFSPANHGLSGAACGILCGHKAGPRRANDRPHGTQELRSRMQSRKYRTAMCRAATHDGAGVAE